MTFEQFSRILIKRWSLVGICVLFVGLGAYIGSSKLIKPLYQSTALIEVTVSFGGSPLNNDNIIASQQLAVTEAQLVTTYPVLSQVAAGYRGLSVDDLAKEVTATARSSTQIIEIDVLDPNPKQAASLANTIAATLIKQQLKAAQQLVAQQLAAQQTAVPPVPGSTPVVQTPASQGDFMVIAQSARAASTPSQPNKLIYAVAGILVGLLLGIALAMLFELLDTRVATKEALTQLLDWPVLGTLWRAGSDEDVINPIGHNSNVEPYSILRASIGLRTNVGLAAMNKPLQTLIVTSGNPNEGKSVVAANLAIFMARAGKNTLLIDANLRRPTLHEEFGIPAHAMGFSNAVLMFSMQTNTNALFASKTGIEGSSTGAVTNEVSLGSFVRAVDIPNLYVMPSGPLPPNPLELLDSKAIQGLFAALSKCGAEVVIFDAPPLLGLSDASILASKVDGTLVVVDINRARRGNLKQVKGQLEQAKAHVLGCVVNKQRRSRKGTSYSYGYRAEKRSNRDSYSRKITSHAVTSIVPPTVLKQPGTPSQSKRNESMVSMQPGIPSQPNRNGPTIAKQPTPPPPSQPNRNESTIAKQPTPPPPSQPKRNEPTIAKQPGTPSQPNRNESTISKQPISSSQPKEEEPTVAKQPEPPSQPKQEEPTVSMQPGTPSQPSHNESTIAKQPTLPSQPKQEEPTVPMQPVRPSQSKQEDGKNDGGKHGINNGDSSAASVSTFNDRDQTIIIPLVGATNSRRKTGDLRESG